MLLPLPSLRTDLAGVRRDADHSGAAKSTAFPPIFHAAASPSGADGMNRGAGPALPAAPTPPRLAAMTFLYLCADTMGSGDPELGRKLLRKFLAELADSDARVDLVGCVNDGVRLTTSEGEALESLRKLEKRGARIASCGTCLDHLALRDALRIGEVGDMKGTVRVMASAERVIRPC